MHKSSEGQSKNLAGTERKRVLARVLAEDLRCVRAGVEAWPDSTVTDPPPGRDLTFVGADGESF